MPRIVTISIFFAFFFAIAMAMYWYLLVALISIFLMTNVNAYLSYVNSHLAVFWEELVWDFLITKKKNT